MLRPFPKVQALESSDVLPGPTKVNGVRIYTSGANSEDSVFYSRRGDGPYYRWLFEEQVGKWRVSRVIDSAFIRQSLSLATWKNVPATLQSRLGEHYLE